MSATQLWLDNLQMCVWTDILFIKVTKNNCCYLIWSLLCFAWIAFLSRAENGKDQISHLKVLCEKRIRRRILKGKSKISFLACFLLERTSQGPVILFSFSYRYVSSETSEIFFYAIRYIQRWNVHILVINILESWWTCANMVFS